MVKLIFGQMNFGEINLGDNHEFHMTHTNLILYANLIFI